jgi:hypothetical protein
VRVPTAIGFFKPVIVVPGWVMQELSADEFNQILLHELAHLRRWDDWTNLAQKVVKALFFFHPAVWWIEKKVSLEREMACDDAVIAETASPRAYAECLTHLAEKTLVQRSMALAQAALGRIRQTSLRVAQILDVDRPTDGTRPWKPAVSLVAGFALICMLGISRAPRLIAFRDSASNPIASPMIAAASPRPVGAQVSQAKFVPQPVQVVPASLKARSINRSVTRYVHTASIQSASASAGVSTMVRPSTMRTSMIPSGDVRLTHTSAAPVAFTETLFVVIEGSTNDDSNQPVYQIQWWRVTVLHPVVAPSSNRIPAKQT